jgi:hypothetical protein
MNKRHSPQQIVRKLRQADESSIGFTVELIPKFLLLVVHDWIVQILQEIRRPLKAPTTMPLPHHRDHTPA